jgi:hypothetical protein
MGGSVLVGIGGILFGFRRVLSMSNARALVPGTIPRLTALTPAQHNIAMPMK